MLLYRVCPVDPGAAVGSPYHPSFVPRSTGQHRIDHPRRYDTLYLSDSPAGAVAERYGSFATWGDWLTEHPRGFTARLATYELGDQHLVLDLDDPRVLSARSLRPSRVVTRDRQTTQRWALDVHGEGRWAGIAWWSFYNPDWSSCGLWCAPATSAIAGLTVMNTEDLHAEHPAVVEAGRSLMRTWRPA